MSRNASGTYTQPLPDVVTGDTIEAAWANTTINDLETEMTDSLSRSGKGNMSVPFKAVAGTVSAPGVAFVDEASSGLYRAGAGDIRMALAGAEFARITSAGLRLASTDLIIGTAGEGIDFSANTGTAATGAATTSELFSFYEEGTWTPNLWDDDLSSSEGQTYSYQVGWYSRIGRLVFFDLSVRMTSLGTLTVGAFTRFGPLPFTASSATNYVGSCSVGETTQISLASIYALTGSIRGAENYVRVYKFNAATGTDTFLISEFTASGRIRMSGHYMV